MEYVLAAVFFLAIVYWPITLLLLIGLGAGLVMWMRHAFAPENLGDEVLDYRQLSHADRTR